MADDHGDHSGHDHGSHEFHASHSSDEGKPWAEAIVAALIINLVTLIGVVALVSAYLKNKLNKAQCDEDKKNIAGTKNEPSLLWKFKENIIPSFACGALLATSVFLIIPESLHMLAAYIEAHPDEFNLEAHDDGDGHDDHGHRFLDEDPHNEDEEGHFDTDIPVAWRFGTCLLGGFLLPLFTTLIIPDHHHPEEPCCHEECCEDKVAAASTNSNKIVVKVDGIDEQVAKPTKTLEAKDNMSKSAAEDPMTVGEACEEAGCEKGEHLCLDHDDDGTDADSSIENSSLEDHEAISKRRALAVSVLLGDFCHNLSDGVLVGTAFLLCDRKLAITISAATVYHELAQELADYFLLTEHCLFRPVHALALNFMGGLSVVFGAILVLSMDVTSFATGCILAVGAGIYLYVAGAECIPRARDSHKCKKDKLLSIVSFMGGAIPIGLVLLNHFHCEEH